MKVVIFTEVPNRSYYKAIYFLKERGEISDIELIGLRDLLKNPFRLSHVFTSDIVIMGFAPYRLITLPLIYFLKIFAKNGVFYTSWPYWNGEKSVHPIYFGLQIPLWKRFLKGTKTVCITKVAKGAVLKNEALATWIPHPIYLKVFNPLPEKHSGIRILYVGRLLEEKGLLLFLNVARKMKKENVEFWIVGDGKLRDSVLKAEEESTVNFKDFIKNEKELAKIYNQCDIFVLPSYPSETWEEVFGISLLEAMACGLAVVATDCVGPKEILLQGKNGFLVQQKNEEELIQKLSELINDEDLRKKVGMNALKTAEDYNIKKISEEWKKQFSI